MTVAVAIHGMDYLIVAADSQESGAAVDLKTHADKIHSRHRQVRMQGESVTAAISITGSGGSRYLEYLKGEIENVFWNHLEQDREFHDFGSTLELYLVSFYQQHFLPFSVHASNEYLDPDLIVAAQAGYKRALWLTYRSTVRREETYGYASIGSGSVWANSILEKFHYRHVDEASATASALYAVFVAKEHSESCGQETVLVSFRNYPEGSEHKGGYMLRATPEAIRRAEEVFRSYGKFEIDILNAVICAPMSLAPKSDAPFRVEFMPQVVQQRIEAMRQEIAAIRFYDHY